MKRKIILVFSLAGLLAGLSVLLYPFISNGIVQAKHSTAISQMTSTFQQYDPQNEEILKLYQQAHLYNAALAKKYKGNGKEIWDYQKQLSFQGKAEMGYLEIPKIKVNMLIYHGTGEDSLSSGVGHLEGTSLPVGGEDTHCVLLAHTGLRTMKAFDDLPKLKVGDSFTVTSLGTSCDYEVCKVEVVLPDEIESLAIQPGKDLVTLVTCTPYGLNSHRLLVHGKRVFKVPEVETLEAPVKEETAVSEEEPEGIDKKLLIAFGIGFLVILQMIRVALTAMQMRREKRR